MEFSANIKFLLVYLSNIYIDIISYNNMWRQSLVGVKKQKQQQKKSIFVDQFQHRHWVKWV